MSWRRNILLLSIAAFVVVYVLFAGNSIRSRFGDQAAHNVPAWRLSLTQGVMIATCVAIVTFTALANHAILGGGLALFFGLVAWIAGHDGIADESVRMNGLYRALGRVDAGTSRQRFGAGLVGRWASTLREADYQILARSIADATKRSDESADALLRQRYDARL
jgi:hypothetical protein